MPEQPSYDEIRQFAARLHDPAHGVYFVDDASNTMNLLH